MRRSVCPPVNWRRGTRAHFGRRRNRLQKCTKARIVALGSRAAAARIMLTIQIVSDTDMIRWVGTFPSKFLPRRHTACTTHSLAHFSDETEVIMGGVVEQKRGVSTIACVAHSSPSIQVVSGDAKPVSCKYHVDSVLGRAADIKNLSIYLHVLQKSSHLARPNPTHARALQQ